MIKSFYNITAEGITYRAGDGKMVPENLLWQDYQNRIHFWCSVQGGVNGSSSSPRTEYRETVKDSSESFNWNFKAEKYNAMIGQCSVEIVPSTEKVIFAQIHAHKASSPFVKLLLSDGKVKAEVRQTPSSLRSPVVLQFPYNLGDKIEYAMNVNSEGVLTIGLNGVSHEVEVDQSWHEYLFYFKAGSYVIDNFGPASEGGYVVYDYLEVYHGSGVDASFKFRQAAKQYLN